MMPMGDSGQPAPQSRTPRPVRAALIGAAVTFLVFLVILRVGVAYSLVLTATAMLFAGVVAIIRGAMRR